MESFDTNKKILITGAAGFIGYHLAKRLLSLGVQVAGLDNMNAYYDVQLKKTGWPGWNCIRPFPSPRETWRTGKR